MSSVILLFSLSVLTDSVLPLEIQQSPPHQLIQPEQEETRLKCHHGDNNYPYMLWYQHKAGKGGGGPRAMELIGLLHYQNPNLEKNFEARFNITGHSKRNAELVISEIKPTDSAEYFCAASRHGASSPLTPPQKLKLTPASNLNCVIKRK
ncbi:uncharacterized protein LOC122862238 [Xyrichtys novacula]|uniref:Uncharacterized protein LOC122862238 n=1 Tax=Xyrichtys novacula TaxID=13765 RepID=A0AAV1GQ84_XYRNO|nr:uncharacterized protein LOC122862238 [Xyrichtys novacula]